MVNGAGSICTVIKFARRDEIDESKLISGVVFFWRSRAVDDENEAEKQTSAATAAAATAAAGNPSSQTADFAQLIQSQLTHGHADLSQF